MPWKCLHLQIKHAKVWSCPTLNIEVTTPYENGIKTYFENVLFCKYIRETGWPYATMVVVIKLKNMSSPN